MSLFSTSPTGIFRRKPVDAIEPETEGGGLAPVLGLWQLTALGIGAIIGAGIFALAGTVAAQQAGPAVLFSFLVAGVVSLAAALAYAEFTSLIPRAGTAYTYGYAVLGEIAGWFIGWDLLLEYTAIVAVVGIGVSGYVGALVEQVGIHLPAWMLGAPTTGPGHVVDLVAALLCLLIAFLLTRGVRSAARVETVLVWVKVGIVLLILVVGVFFISTKNYVPFVPFGWGGVFSGAAIVFFAVFGYDALSSAAEESADARKHLPKAMLLSFAICMVLYVLACLVLTGMVYYKNIAPKGAFAHAFEGVGLPGIATIISVGAILGIVTVMFTFMFAVTRVWYAMSRDGLLPRWFSKVSPRHRVPTRVTWIVGIASALIAGFVPIGDAAELTNIGILLAFVVVCSAVIVLRYRHPELERPFRCPGMPVVPAIGIVGAIWLTIYLKPLTWVRFVSWFVIGLVIYAAYSYRKSLLGKRMQLTKD
ncbi:amino acid permease [Fodinicola acaciae]|uniref:amino acid permease n=1 Tax=Fodinicola acaciae TaxID=2681555 RepID=UPI0013D293DE|nr:amino acid permease [Fodinicola acaciae]